MHTGKYLKLIIAVLVIFVTLFLSGKIYSVINTNKKIIKKTAVLPDFKFLTIHGKRFGKDNLVKNLPSILIYFSPGCHYCMSEVDNIIANIDSFNNTNIMLVSAQPLNILVEFYNAYGLKEYPQIKLLYTDRRDFISAFGDAVVPATFIYDEKDRLLMNYKGETCMEAIRKIIVNSANIHKDGLKGN